MSLEMINDNISIICACKNRYDALKLSLISWLMLNEINEIIIVDWNSDKQIDDLLFLDERIKIIRVEDREYFNICQPLNLAASFVTNDYILKLDCDYIINPYFNFLNDYVIDENCFVSGNSPYNNLKYLENSISQDTFDLQEFRDYVNSYSEYYMYLKGLLFVSTENFKRVGGYNENIKSYGCDDDDIIIRLEKLNLEHKKMNYDHRVIHIPHSDEKRIEHSQEYKVEDKNYFMNIMRDEYSGECLKFQVDYALVKHYTEMNKNRLIESNDSVTSVKSKTFWITQEISKNYYSAKEVNMVDEKKLDGIYSVYYITLEESIDRQRELQKQFSWYGITPKSIISKRFSESDDKISGKYLYTLNDGTKGCCVSHLKAINQWYKNTDDDYGFFCEDDLSLETVQYWDFTWEKFIEKIPEDAECVQLLTIRDNYDTFELRERKWDDWGVTAYIITRDYAKKIIDTFIKDDCYHLEIPNQDVMPLIENILFASVGKTYTVPLFVENIEFNSTFVGKDDDVKEGQKTNHKLSRNLVLKHWQSEKVKETELEILLKNYAVDTENPEHNFNLGVWYEKEGHTAPALSYYLRCAERSEDQDLAYEALIRGSYCYDKQKERDGSSRSLLFQAQAFRPDRPEAYYLLSRYAERKEWWQDCYINADLALRYCNFDCNSLRTSVEYPGRYGLLYEKAVSGWWWGKSEESKLLLLEILEKYKLSEIDQNTIKERLKSWGFEIQKQTNNSDFKYPENFNWSNLTYEDIITIEREIVHEKVYRFWRDVKENDVVLDIGASVGAYTISILDQKPKKVYCVEPSENFSKILMENCSLKTVTYQQNPLSIINCGIIEDLNDNINIFGEEKKFTPITFKNMIEKYSIDYVNYMKVDCEGGEYAIFKDENMEFLKNKVDFIAMEMHLNYPGCREKFKHFRDRYLTQFKNYKVMSCTRQTISWGNSIDLKDKIFDNNFIDNYTCEFMIYINNY